MVYRFAGRVWGEQRRRRSAAWCRRLFRATRGNVSSRFFRHGAGGTGQRGFFDATVGEGGRGARLVERACTLGAGICPVHELEYADGVGRGWRPCRLKPSGSQWAALRSEHARGPAVNLIQTRPTDPWADLTSGSQRTTAAVPFRRRDSSVAILGPRIGPVRVAAYFPETEFVFGEKRDAADEFCALPRVELRHNHARGTAVFA